jgi:arylsulfatase A-like enzyme
MKRRTALGLGAGAVASLVGYRCASLSRRPKNILLICVDDLNHWVGHLHSPQKAYTPWMDQLASRGTVFTHAYCPAPYCNSSRMAVFTGRLPSSSGIYRDQPFWDRPNRPLTFFELLRQQGYYIFGSGKVFHGRYDYQAAQRQGLTYARWLDVENRPWLWDHFMPMKSERLSQPFPHHGIRRDPSGRPWSPQFDWGVLTADQERDHADVATASAVSEFLKRPRRQPFLCVAGFYKPHLPWYVPKRFFDRYPLDTLAMPSIDPDDLNDVPAVAREWALTPADQATLQSKGLEKKAVQAYRAAISFVDEQIGTVLQSLWASPLRDDTIVALWSDNGFHLGEKLHWRKFTLWEEATRVPLIISSPTAGSCHRTVPSPVSLVDLFPTLFELAGLPAVANLDAHSLVPLMCGDAQSANTAAITTWGQGNHSLRQEGWRYTRYAAGGEELYDLTIDPLERRNLINSPDHRLQRQRMRRDLDAVTSV